MAGRCGSTIGYKGLPEVKKYLNEALWEISYNCTSSKITSNIDALTGDGSFGSWYNFNYIIDFFINYLKKNINSRLIILTQSDIPREYYKLSMDIKKKIILISSRRDFIPIIVGISDLTLCFIKPTFSKKFSSPTKVGESLGCGIL